MNEIILEGTLPGVLDEIYEMFTLNAFEKDRVQWQLKMNEKVKIENNIIVWRKKGWINGVLYS